MKPSVVIAVLTAAVSAELSTTYRDDSSAGGNSPLSNLATAQADGDVSTTFATLPRRQKLEATTTHMTADPWPTTFQQFESTTKRPKTHRPKKILCTEPPPIFPTTFQQFPSVYRATKCRPTKGHNTPDPKSAQPTHVSMPQHSVLDHWKAHPPHIIITPTTTVETPKTTGIEAIKTAAA